MQPGAYLSSFLFCLYLKMQASLVTQMVKNLPAMWETKVWSLGWEDSLEKKMATPSSIPGASLMAQIKRCKDIIIGSSDLFYYDRARLLLIFNYFISKNNLKNKNWIKQEMATHSSILAWGIQWTEEPGGVQSMGLQRVRHDWVTKQQQWLL